MDDVGALQATQGQKNSSAGSFFFSKLSMDDVGTLQTTQVQKNSSAGTFSSRNCPWMMWELCKRRRSRKIRVQVAFFITKLSMDDVGALQATQVQENSSAGSFFFPKLSMDDVGDLQANAGPEKLECR